MILIWWVVSARKWFKGPKVNVQHMMLGREADHADVLVGEEVKPNERNSDSDEGSFGGAKGMEAAAGTASDKGAQFMQ